MENKMDFITRFYSIVRPQKALERMLYQDSIRNYYDAAESGRETGNWTTVNATGEQSDQSSRDIIRSRARDLERNSDFMENLILPFVNNVVGNGFTLQAKVKDDNQNDISDINVKIERLFKKWCRHKNCDVSGQSSFKELCEMAIRRMKVDGGIIFIKVYDNKGEFPFKLQAIEVDELDSSLQSVYTNSKSRIVSGIEIDENNRPLKYHFRKVTIDGMSAYEEDKVIDAERVMFLFMKNRPTQLREMSPLAKTIKRIKDIDGFMNALQIKERVAACLSVFITKVDSTGLGSRRTSVDEQSGYNQETLAPGMIMKLKPGENIQAVNPANSGGSSESFIQIQQRIAGAGQGLSYEASSRDMSKVNYSSARQGLLEDRKEYRKYQDYMIEHFLDEVYEEFVKMIILNGMIDIDINDYLKNKDKYLAHSWIPTGWDWIDPLKEVNANSKAVDSNIDTLERICAEKGLDWKEVLEQRAKEKEYINSFVDIKNTDEGGSK